MKNKSKWQHLLKDKLTPPYPADLHSSIEQQILAAQAVSRPLWAYWGGAAVAVTLLVVLSQPFLSTNRFHPEREEAMNAWVLDLAEEDIVASVDEDVLSL